METQEQKLTIHQFIEQENALQEQVAQAIRDYFTSQPQHERPGNVLSFEGTVLTPTEEISGLYLQNGEVWAQVDYSESGDCEIGDIALHYLMEIYQMLEDREYDWDIE